MDNETISSNIEWKKNKGFGATEKVSRRVDKEKTMEQEAKAKKPVILNNAPMPMPNELPKGIKKLRNKIKDVYDEDEEEGEFYTFLSNDGSSSLLNALYDDERKQLGLQEKTINNQKMQQDAGRMEALRMANKISRELGFNNLDKKIVSKNMQDPLINNRDFEKILKDDVLSKAKISSRQLSKGETISLLRGIKRIKKVAMLGKDADVRAIEGMKIDDIIKAGEKGTDENKVAEIILKKSGRKNKKDVARKIKDNPNVSQKTKETAKQIEKIEKAGKSR